MHLNVHILVDYCMNESIINAVVTAINLLLSQNTVFGIIFYPEFVSVSIIRCTL